MKAKYLAIALPVFAVAFAFTIAPVLASCCGGDDNGCEEPRKKKAAKILVTNDNNACVSNDVGSISNSGMNNASGNKMHGKIKTGNADATAYSETTANGNETRIKVRRFKEIKVHNSNYAGVDNNVGAISNTGLNQASGNGSYYEKRMRHCGRCMWEKKARGNGQVETGNAYSWAESMTMLNTNMTAIQ